MDEFVKRCSTRPRLSGGAIENIVQLRTQNVHMLIPFVVTVIFLLRFTECIPDGREECKLFTSVILTSLCLVFTRGFDTEAEKRPGILTKNLSRVLNP